MSILTDTVNYIFELNSYILLPILIIIIALFFSVKLLTAIKSALYIGVGLIGISMLFSFFIENLTPLVETLINNTGKEAQIIDVGWPILSAFVWSIKVAPLTIPIALILNILMLSFNLTNTFNVDIWNYWHIALIGVITYFYTGSFILFIVAVISATVVLLKIADYSIFVAKGFFKAKAVNTTTMTSSAYLSVSVALDKAIDKIPVINKISFVPSELDKKYSYIIDPVFVSFLVGIVLSLIAGYDLNNILSFALKITAVFLILPKIVFFIQEGFYPLSADIKTILVKSISLKDRYS